MKLRRRIEQIMEGSPAELAELQHHTTGGGGWPGRSAPDVDPALAPAMLEGTPAPDAPATRWQAHLYACDHCGHWYVCTAADRDGRPCRFCPPWGRLRLVGYCSVDVRLPDRPPRPSREGRISIG